MSEITEEQELLYTAQTGNSAHSNAVTKNTQTGNSAHSNAVTKNNMTVITQIAVNNKTWDYTTK